MARQNATNFTGALQFPYATAAADIFKKEDVQTLAQAVDQHDHTTGKGVAVNTTPANASITNAKLGPDVARANLLVNPGFEIWQRGTAFSTNGAWTADRWQMTVAAGDAYSVSRDTANADTGSQYCAFISVNGSAGSNLAQLVEAAAVGLKGRTISFSARVKASAVNAVRAGLGSNGTGGTTAFSVYHTGNGLYQTLTVTYTVPADATTVVPAVVLTTSSIQSIYVDNACLVVGSQPADYVPLHPADDLARCLRYFEANLYGSAFYIAPGQVWSTTAAAIPLRFLAHKAVTPTVTVGAVGGYCLSPAGFGQTVCTALTAASLTADNVGLGATVASGLVAGNATVLMGNGSGGTIAIEANP